MRSFHPLSLASARFHSQRLLLAIICAMVPCSGAALFAQGATGSGNSLASAPIPPSSVAAAIAAATRAAVTASPGQAASITAAALSSTAKALGSSSTMTMAITKQTVSAVVSLLASMNLREQVSATVAAAIAIAPKLEAEITRAAIEAAPELRSLIIKAAEQGKSAGSSQTAGATTGPAANANANPAQQDIIAITSMTQEIDTIIDQVNAQSPTANPSVVVETPLPSPTPTPSPSPTATPVSPHS